MELVVAVTLHADAAHEGVEVGLLVGGQGHAGSCRVLPDGHGVLRYTGLIAVSARTENKLEESVSAFE